MALIKCPKCGGNVSDRTVVCIHCGFELKEKEIKKCVECGAELEEDAVVCKECGCPVDYVDKKQSDTQNVQLTGIKIKGFLQNSKKKIIIAASVLGVLVVGTLGFQIIQKQNATKVSEDYGQNLELVSTMMLDGASEAETAGNLIKSVWYNSIFEEYDSETDKYTMPDGYFLSDFNDALSNLFEDSDFNDNMSSIETNQNSVASMMKSMQNPPEEYIDAYDSLQEFYDSYLSFTNIVINPSGNLQTFSSNFSGGDSDVLSCYNKMELYY